MLGKMVTIGICARNARAIIEKAMESVVKQDFPHELMEVVFVDDGSEDDTISVVERFIPQMDIDVRIFKIKWSGLGRARNIIVENARGKYIVWLDADMFLLAGCVKKEVELMEKNLKVGISKAMCGNEPAEKLIGFLECAAYQAVYVKYGGKPTTRSLGTGGSIYRTDAIRQVGGFDGQIAGAGEDIDAEYRVRKAGWLLFRDTNMLFYERRRNSWKALWDEYFWHGYGLYNVFRKNTEEVAPITMSPMAGLVAGLWYSIIAYKIHHRKIVFLLPVEYFFKRIAWFLGFVKSQLESRVK